ncbi:MAG: N-acetylmuramoyl-L-alanine amidase family protein [Lachnospiraceae bacterium]|nr:N-acetylmuramoyl-L-alanine amidase family protein [Lachnospiraceae bacterium]
MALALTVVLLAGFLPVDVMAATKPINTVSVKVNSKLEAGKSLPDIVIGSGSPEDGGIIVTKDSANYTVVEAEWVDKPSEVLNAADQPRMTVTLEPVDVSEHYFLASYKESNVKVSGGSFVSAKRDGDNLVVTLRVNPIRGDYDMPKDAYWNEKNLGEAKWEPGENDSGYYEVQLLRDGKNVHKVDKTTSKNYNFYPYMTKAGDYSFKVRAIPGTDFQKKYGKKSDQLESGELQITDRYVSDGKGQQNAKSTVKKSSDDKTTGWFKEGDVWRYRYPNGELCTNGWGKINDLWYFFDGSGNMVTGWQQVGADYYHLHNNGQMALGWNKINGQWYFFRTEAEGVHAVGSMVSSGWRVIGPYYYFFNKDGSLYTGWLQQDGKWYYLNTVDNSLQGAMFTGWINRDEKTYFAEANGAIVEGWCQIDGQWYYFYPGSGEMARNTWIDGQYVDGDGVWK